MGLFRFLTQHREEVSGKVVGVNNICNSFCEISVSLGDSNIQVVDYYGNLDSSCYVGQNAFIEGVAYFFPPRRFRQFIQTESGSVDSVYRTYREACRIDRERKRVEREWFAFWCY